MALNMHSRRSLYSIVMLVACSVVPIMAVDRRDGADGAYLPSLRRWAGMYAVDGKLYMFGGRGTSYFQTSLKSYNSFYEYDVKSRTWRDLSTPSGGSAPTERYGVELAVLGGKLYVYGGHADGNQGNDLFEYDLATQSWADLSTPASGMAPRQRDTLEFYPYNGMLFLFGGIAGKADYIYLHTYDVASRTWTDLSHTWGGTATFLRYKMGLAAYDGKFYVFGGRESGGGVTSKTPYNDLKEFDIATSSWVDLSTPNSGTPPSPRDGVGMVGYNRKLYIFGGHSERANVNELYEFDLSMRAWTDLSTPAGGSPPSARISMKLLALGGKLYVSGGYDYKVSFELNNDLHEYDIAARTWTDLSTPTDDSEEL